MLDGREVCLYVMIPSRPLDLSHLYYSPFHSFESTCGIDSTMGRIEDDFIESFVPQAFLRQWKGEKYKWNQLRWASTYHIEF